MKWRHLYGLTMLILAGANAGCFALDWEFESIDDAGGQGGEPSGSGGTSNGATSSNASGSSSSTSSSAGGPSCGNESCETGEGCGTCPADCACAGGQPCQNNTCVGCGQAGQACCNGSSCSAPYVCTGGVCQSPGSVCGNGMKEAGEICDGNDLAGATCQSQGFTGGTLACNPTCSGFNSSGCCTNECSVGAAMCSGGVVQTCGNYDADTCYEYGGSQTCTNGQTCVGSGCGCVASNSGQFMVTDHVYPSFGPAGCSGDGLGKMKLSAQMTSPTTLTFYVRKEDNSSFTGSGTLRVFVGSGPNCTNVVNESKTTASIVVGQSTQTINLSLYNGSWALNETKQFWVGKEEGGNLAYRASSTVSVQRTCIP